MSLFEATPYQNLILTGPMGTGKTSVGRAVATRLGARFFDLENEILAREGQSVESIRELFGEDVATLVDGVTKLEGITFTSRDEAQAENYRKVVRACLNVPKCTGITVWGIADSESWRSSERGLLFTGGSGSYTKKAAYTAVLDELNKGRPQGPVS